MNKILVFITKHLLSFFLILTGFEIFDCLSTTYLLKTGVGYELNPFFSYWGMPIKIATPLVMWIVYARYSKRFESIKLSVPICFVALTAMYLCVVSINFFTMIKVTG